MSCITSVNMHSSLSQCRGPAPLPTAGDNPDGLSTAAAVEGAFPMAPDLQPWITRIDPNYGQPRGHLDCCNGRFRTALQAVPHREEEQAWSGGRRPGCSP